MSNVLNELERENLGFIVIEQKSKAAVADIQRQLDELRRTLEDHKREIPQLEQCVVEAKSKRKEIEHAVEIELEKLFPKQCVFVASSVLEPITPRFSFTFLRSYKLSDKSFATLDYPNLANSVELNQDEDKKQITRNKAMAAIRRIFNDAIHSQTSLSGTNMIRLQAPFSQSEISIYHHRSILQSV